MREIRFRGKNITTGEWVYGDYVYTFDRGYYSQSHEDVPERCHYIETDRNYYEVDGRTVGQFTGLRDKAKTEIYEGDILQYGEIGNILDRKIGVVKYFGADNYPAFDLDSDVGSECNGLSLIMAEMECEVIGNIHDHKIDANKITTVKIDGRKLKYSKESKEFYHRVLTLSD